MIVYGLGLYGGVSFDVFDCRASTWSPILKVVGLARERLSAYSFIFSFCDASYWRTGASDGHGLDTSGSLIFTGLPNMSSAGEAPVVGWGVDR